MSDDTVSPCTNEEDLVALALGESEEPRKAELLAHIATCEACAAVYADHVALVGALGEVPPPKTANHLEAVLNAARDVPQDPRAKVLTLRRVALAMGVVALAAALAFRVGAPKDDPMARGSGSPPAQLCYVAGTACNPLRPATKLTPEARYSLDSESRGASARFGLAFVLDSTGEVHWVFPPWTSGPPPPEARLPQGLSRDAVQFPTIAFGSAHAYVLTSEMALKVAEVEQLPTAERTEARLRATFPAARISVVPIDIASP